jgi:hypothetical protein
MKGKTLTPRMVMLGISFVALTKGDLTTNNKKFDLIIKLLVKFLTEGNLDAMNKLIDREKWVSLPLLKICKQNVDFHEFLETTERVVEEGYMSEGNYLLLCEDVKLIHELDI